MITYYAIPKDVHYVQFIDIIETWEKVDGIFYDIPTVAVIDDSKATHYTRFVVLYKGMMQMQGGGGSCYNPCIPTFLHKEDPMDNSKMPRHMSKWQVYSYDKLLKMVIAAKCELLEKMGYEKLPCLWYWNLKNYNVLQGILIAKLNAIGMGKADYSILNEKDCVQQRKLLCTSN